MERMEKVDECGSMRENRGSRVYRKSEELGSGKLMEI